MSSTVADCNKVSVVYATADRQIILTVPWLENLTVQQAIVACDMAHYCPDINLSEQPVGIFSERCTMATVVKPGDRIEIYRPLLIDPKEARRRRAQDDNGGA